MLKSNLLKLRISPDKSITPIYVRENNYELRKRASAISEIFANSIGRARKELDEQTSRFRKGKGDRKINGAFVELLYDRCTFEAATDVEVVRIRQRLFEEAAKRFPVGTTADDEARSSIVAGVGEELGFTADEVERLMFSDLKEAQLLESFEELSPVELIKRYNLALAQGALVHSYGMTVILGADSPQRIRQLFRYLKFFKLMFSVNYSGEQVRVKIDGPISVLEQTRAYGVRLASFLPALLLLSDFEMEAEVKWKRKRCYLHLSPEDGLTSHYRDVGAWTPPEMAQFRDRVVELAEPGTAVAESNAIISLGGKDVLIPDLVLKRGDRKAYLEIIWPWRKVNWKKHFSIFKKHSPDNAFLVVSTRSTGSEAALHCDDPRVIFYRLTPPANKAVKAVEGYLNPRPGGLL